MTLDPVSRELHLKSPGEFFPSPETIPGYDAMIAEIQQDSEETRMRIQREIQTQEIRHCIIGSEGPLAA